MSSSLTRPLAAALVVALAAVGLSTASASARSTEGIPATHIAVAGSNSANQLSDYATAAGTSTIIDTAIGNSAVWMLKGDGTVTAAGAVGNSDVANVNAQIGTRTVRDLSGGLFGYAAVMTDGTVAFWGGTEEEGTAAVAGKTISKVVVAGHHAAALTAGGELIEWGSDSSGQISGASAAIGANDVVDVAVSDQATVVLLDDGSVVGWGSNVYGEVDPYTPTSPRIVVSLGAGQGMTTMVLDDGTVVVRGYQQALWPDEVSSAVGDSHVVGVSSGSSAIVLYLEDGGAVAVSYYPENAENAQAVIDAANGKRIQQVTFGPYNVASIYSDVLVEFTSSGEQLDEVVVAAGDVVDVNAGGLTGKTAFTLKFDSATVDSGTTNASGGFSGEVTVPTPTTAGTHSVSLTTVDGTFSHSVKVGAVMASATPTIAGTVKVNNTLTAVRGAWAPGVSFTYQWLREGSAIGGAAASTYALQPADYKKHIQVKVTGSKIGFATVSKTSAKTVAVAAGILTAGTPTVSGTMAVGSTVTAVPGSWSPVTPTYSYQWYANGVAISKATKSTYVIPGAALDKLITVRVSGSATGYVTAVAYSAIGGFVDRGTLTIPGMFPVSDSDAVGYTYKLHYSGTTPEGTLSYQWYRDTTMIVGATKSSYKATAADVGLRLKVQVTAYKVGYVGATRLSSTSNIVKAQAATTASLTMTGTPKAGSTLTLTAKGSTPGSTLTYGIYAYKGDDYVDFDVVDGFPTKFVVPSGIKGWTIIGWVHTSKTGLASSDHYSKAVKALS